ncbi:transposase family protein, partial [Thiolapillus sp.]|uniref:transposase family protein n=1 Tax=Thiolapillus sp. TaxID=2017437 RepID=UPI003AF5FEDC
MELEEHYSQLLGINSPWEIYDVELKVDESRLDIWIEYMDDRGACPECGAACPRHDTRKERTWRHLDTMQFATYLHCNVPRVRC